MPVSTFTMYNIWQNKMQCACHVNRKQCLQLVTSELSLYELSNDANFFHLCFHLHQVSPASLMQTSANFVNKTYAHSLTYLSMAAMYITPQDAK